MRSVRLPGQGGKYRIVTEPMGAANRKAIQQDGKTLYVFAYLLYSDDFEAVYEVATLLAHRRGMEGFVVVDAPEYNYSRRVKRDN